MRYRIGIILDKSEIPKDKNRMILSFWKHCLAESDENYFDELYVKGMGERKDFAFSIYMKDAKFLRETISVPDKRLILNFSTYDILTGIKFYNAMNKSRGRKFLYKDEISMQVESITLIREKLLTSNKLVFKTLSPIVVREHFKEENRDYFHSLMTEKGKALFLENLKYQLISSIPEAIYDVKEIEIKIKSNKEVKVWHYGIQVLSNLSIFEIEAAPYILEYMYKAGVGSMKTTGFGLIDVM